MASSTFLGGPPAARAYVWDGGGANDNFSTPANWNPNGAPVNDGTADLQFSGTTRLTPVAEAAYSVNLIFFSTNAGAFTLSGGALTVGEDGIFQTSSNAQTINNSVTAGVSQTWSFGNGAGALTLNNDLIVSATGTGPTLSLSGGTVNVASSSNAFVLGAEVGETGRLNFSGTASMNAQTIYVGLNGSGFVTQSGGSISNPLKALHLAFRTSAAGTFRSVRAFQNRKNCASSLDQARVDQSPAAGSEPAQKWPM